MNKPKIYIDGKEGTTGLQIYERLGGRDDLELLLIDEDKRKDTEERRKFLNAADLVFLCLPDAAAVEAVSLIENGNTKVIDASTAHRTAPGWGLRLCGAVQAPPGADLREHAGLEPRAATPPGSSALSIPWWAWASCPPTRLSAASPSPAIPAAGRR